MSDFDIEKYRHQTRVTAPLNHARKFCRGCNMQRSLGQFVAESDFCAQCVRRGVAAVKPSLRRPA